MTALLLILLQVNKKLLTHTHSHTHNTNLWIAVVQWLASGTPTGSIRVGFPSDWLLHHGDNRGRQAANHNLLPEMHLRVTTCLTLSSFKISGREIIKSCETFIVCDTRL